MHTDRLLLIGAGGHAKVVADAVLATGVSRDRLIVRDGNPARAGTKLLGIPVVCPELDVSISGVPVHVAIGANGVRRVLADQVSSHGCPLATVAHPLSILSAHAELADGVFVAARAVVAPSARIGRGAIINHGAIVDHDCEVFDFVHVAPGAVLGGSVTVAAEVLIGAGAVILPGISIGKGAVIGAGAVVTKHVPAGQTWVGTPARRTDGEWNG